MTSVPQTPDGKYIADAKLEGGFETRPYKNHQRSPHSQNFTAGGLVTSSATVNVSIGLSLR
jgi:hypothetical protein